MRAAFSAHHVGPGRDGVGVDDLGEHAEVRELGAGDGVAGEQQAPGQHRAEPVEEHVERAERRAEEPRRRHPDLACRDRPRDVGHERELEPAAERVAADLGDGDLRVAQERRGRSRTSCGRPSRRRRWLGRRRSAPSVRPCLAVAVPGVRVVHVGAGAEHAALAAEQHDLDVVVVGELVEVLAELLAHRRVVGVRAPGLSSVMRAMPVASSRSISTRPSLTELASSAAPWRGGRHNRTL